MRKKKPKVVPPENIQVMPPKLNSPIKDFHAGTEQLKLTREIDERNAESQRKQDRKNTFFTWTNIIIAILSLAIAYLSYDATQTAKAATQAATDATNKQLQLESTIHQLQSKLSEHQSKNDAMRANVEDMKAVLKKHGIVAE